MYNQDTELKVLQDELSVIRCRICRTKSLEALWELHRQEDGAKLAEYDLIREEVPEMEKTKEFPEITVADIAQYVKDGWHIYDISTERQTKEYGDRFKYIALVNPNHWE